MWRLGAGSSDLRCGCGCGALLSAPSCKGVGESESVGCRRNVTGSGAPLGCCECRGFVVVAYRRFVSSPTNARIARRWISSREAFGTVWDKRAFACPTSRKTEPNTTQADEPSGHVFSASRLARRWARPRLSTKMLREGARSAGIVGQKHRVWLAPGTLFSLRRKSSAGGPLLPLRLRLTHARVPQNWAPRSEES